MGNNKKSPNVGAATHAPQAPKQADRQLTTTKPHQLTRFQKNSEDQRVQFNISPRGRKFVWFLARNFIGSSNRLGRVTAAWTTCVFFIKKWKSSNDIDVLARLSNQILHIFILKWRLRRYKKWPKTCGGAGGAGGAGGGGGGGRFAGRKNRHILMYQKLGR